MSQNKTVLFVGVNAHGHINPLLGIADKLKDEFSYKTIFLMMEPLDGDLIKRHGHELILLKNGAEKGDEPAISASIRQLGDAFKKEPVEALINVLSHMFEACMEELAPHHEAYAEAVKSIRPDLIVSDMALPLPCIMNEREIPCVRVDTSNPFMFACSKRPDGIRPPFMIGTSLLSGKEERRRMAEEEPDKWQAILDEWKRADDRIREAKIGQSPRINEFFTKHGCCEISLHSRAFDSPFLNVYLFPREIDYEREDDLVEYPPRWFRCDQLIKSQPDKEGAESWKRQLDEAMVGKEAMVYFSLGTLASNDVDLVRRFLEIFAQDPKRLYVVSKGMNGDQLELAENMVGANYVPQTLMLQRANLAIIHGGNNSLTECLHYGVPMIVLPVFADQMDNAQRVEDLSLGKRLNIFESTKEEVLGSIDAILSNKKLIEKVRNIGEQMRARDDRGKLAWMLRKLAEDKQLEESFIRDCKNKSVDEIKMLISGCCNSTASVHK